MLHRFVRKKTIAVCLLTFAILTCLIFSFQNQVAVATNSQLVPFRSMRGVFGRNASGYNESVRLTESLVIVNTRVKIFNASNEARELQEFVLKQKYMNVRLKTPGTDSKIFVYPASIDRWVSGSLIASGTWEPATLKVTEDLLRSHPGMAFLDLGCNIGVFTLLAARLGRRVVAVDANKQNLMLMSMSLDLNDLRRNVTVIWNAVSDKYENVTLKEEVKNIGGWSIQSGKQPNKTSILTIALDDLAYLFGREQIFMKIDIERSEWNALNSGKKFFDAVNVTYVLMEFMWHRTNQQGKWICEFMTSRGYQAVPIGSLQQKPLNVGKYSTWPDNVIWFKK